MSGCSDMCLWFKHESILLSMALINTITESNLGREGVILACMLQTIIRVSEGATPVQVVLGYIRNLAKQVVEGKAISNVPPCFHSGSDFPSGLTINRKLK